MRTEQEMMDLILSYARQDERVRAVAMNGSRTNPRAARDTFQDYDIVYLVTDVASFRVEPEWINVFGERIMMQTPEDMPLFPSEGNGERYAYLMLFADGNRIDLTLLPIGERETYVQEDQLTVVLLDKDEQMPVLPPPTDASHRVELPTAVFYADCCNEFWWVATYVAKGWWRRQFLYAREHLDRVLRPMVMKMIEWNVAIDTNGSANLGSMGKYVESYVDEATWNQLMRTYGNGTYESVWQSLEEMTALFRRLAKEVAAKQQYVYPEKDDSNVTAYLAHVRQMPPKEIEYNPHHDSV